MIASIGKYRVKVLGRTVEDGGMLWMVSSLSEIGLKVSEARYLRLVLQADDSVGDSARGTQTPRFGVRVDGDLVVDRRMEEREETVSVFESRTPWGAEVHFQKLSEGTQSLLAVRRIVTDGKVEPLAEKGLKIEFIGDSITAGYGVEGRSGEEDFSTATENAGKSYAGLAAAWLDADAMLSAFSGHGIVSGFTGDPEQRNESELVPPYYEAVGRNGFRLPSGRIIEEIPWDFSAWQPDKVLVNLGTNDLSWVGDHADRKDEYRQRFKEFLYTVRKNNPGAMILCILGIMGTGLNDYMVKAVNEYRAEAGDNRIHSMTLQEQDMARDGCGSNYHPSAQTQRRLAEKVKYFIENA